MMVDSQKATPFFQDHQSLVKVRASFDGTSGTRFPPICPEAFFRSIPTLPTANHHWDHSQTCFKCYLNSRCLQISMNVSPNLTSHRTNLAQHHLRIPRIHFRYYRHYFNEFEYVLATVTGFNMEFWGKSLADWVSYQLEPNYLWLVQVKWYVGLWNLMRD